ncbi:hypothetical protein [Blautia sp. MSJ-19]|uniref:hypothetical protein n=1 Tax=Blautia sp. MSJ-19 TaxID=2841517 RepID=UPI001C0EBF4E|nr:hypothetical protein [Blautia sp. MSJ-19]MBU5482128.1 hypothetical protein [Blautia sp. MSJ-19]
MKLVTKTFDELTTAELYEIYKLRISVFVVEQNCPYQEIDDADKVAICGCRTKTASHMC